VIHTGEETASFTRTGDVGEVSAREQWTYPYATLARVIDGDSFVADVRCGMDFGSA
jgi:hypothetical protein